jgi:hypothetical protein
VDIEQIDITGGGNNTLTLDVSEVLNLSSHSNTLVVRRNAGDVVNIGPGWTQQANEVIGPDTFEVFTQGAAILKIQLAVASSTIVGSFVNHVGYTGSGSSIDTGKVLAKEGAVPTLLTYDNLINTSRGINGLAFDIDSLPGTPTAADFVFQMSPTGAFDLVANPVGSWTGAPAPSSVSVTPGSPDRVSLDWPDNVIANRWLRITVLASANTGLSEPEVYYIGHLLGETTGASGAVFTVSFADISPIRVAVGSTVGASSTVDIDKNGTVAFADISAMRPNVGAQLTIITIPGAGSGIAAMASGGERDGNGSNSTAQALLSNSMVAEFSGFTLPNDGWMVSVHRQMAAESVRLPGRRDVSESRRIGESWSPNSEQGTLFGQGIFTRAQFPEMLSRDSTKARPWFFGGLGDQRSSTSQRQSLVARGESVTVSDSLVSDEQSGILTDAAIEQLVSGRF